MIKPPFSSQRPSSTRRSLSRPFLFGLGVLGVFVLVIAVLLLQPASDAIDDDELAALIAEAEADGGEPITPYYLEAAAERASIQIDSDPEGAVATLDAEVVGLTPLGLSGLRPGYYAIRVDHPDHLPLDTTLYLASGAAYELDVLLDDRAFPDGFDEEPADLAMSPSERSDARSPAAAPRSAEPSDAAPRDRTQRITGAAPGGPPGADSGPAARFRRADAETIKRVWTTGSLSVTTTPAGARVVVDGQVRGTTPLSVTSLRPGSHQVTLTLPNRKALSYTVQVEAGAVHRLEGAFGDG